MIFPLAPSRRSAEGEGGGGGGGGSRGGWSEISPLSNNEDDLTAPPPAARLVESEPRALSQRNDNVTRTGRRAHASNIARGSRAG